MEERAVLVVLHAVVEDEVHVVDEVDGLQVKVAFALLLHHLERDRRLDDLDVVIKILAECLARNIAEEGTGVRVEVQEVKYIPALLPPHLGEGHVIEIVHLLLDLHILVVAVFLVLLVELVLLVPLVPSYASVAFLRLSDATLVIIVLVIVIFFAGIVRVLLIHHVVLILILILLVCGTGNVVLRRASIHLALIALIVDVLIVFVFAVLILPVILIACTLQIDLEVIASIVDCVCSFHRLVAAQADEHVVWFGTVLLDAYAGGIVSATGQAYHVLVRAVLAWTQCNGVFVLHRVGVEEGLRRHVLVAHRNAKAHAGHVWRGTCWLRHSGHLSKGGS